MRRRDFLEIGLLGVCEIPIKILTICVGKIEFFGLGIIIHFMSGRAQINNELTSYLIWKLISFFFLLSCQPRMARLDVINFNTDCIAVKTAEKFSA